MRILKLTAVAVVFALAGCASTEERSTMTAVPGSAEVDAAKVAAVNHEARQRGVRVIWVHKPKKKNLVAANG
jgi:hypothetical protein